MARQPHAYSGKKTTRTSRSPELLLVLAIIGQAQWDMHSGEERARESAKKFFRGHYYRHLLGLVQSCIPETAHWAEDTLPTGITLEDLR